LGSQLTSESCLVPSKTTILWPAKAQDTAAESPHESNRSQHSSFDQKLNDYPDVILTPHIHPVHQLREQAMTEHFEGTRL